MSTPLAKYILHVMVNVYDANVCHHLFTLFALESLKVDAYQINLNMYVFNLNTQTVIHYVNYCRPPIRQVIHKLRGPNLNNK